MKLPDFSRIPRAIAVDLDGTLLNSQTALSERSRRALEHCISAGIPVVIATSRAERSVIRYIPEELLERCSLICANGAVAKGAPPLSGNFRETIPVPVACNIVRLAQQREPGARITAEVDGFYFGLNVKLDPQALWEINSATPDKALTLEEAIERDTIKISVNGLGRDLTGLIEELSRQFPDVSVVPSGKMTFLNIVSVHTSKTAALRKLLEPHGISPSEVLAFGDDIPDVELLQQCGMSVAMANAEPDILAVCLYITASNDEDGVAVVLEKIPNMI